MKKILIVVDYQNDFVVGALGFPHAKELDFNICKKIAEYEASGDEIVYTLDIHQKNYLQTREGKHLPKEHCVNGTDGMQLYGRTGELLTRKKVFKKRTFGSAELFEYLKNEKYEKVELVGLVAGICVLTNAVLALTALPDAQIAVDLSCTADDDAGVKDSVVEIMKDLHITAQ